jgi:hypothetical protein
MHPRRPLPKRSGRIAPPAKAGSDDEPPAFCFMYASKGFQICDLYGNDKAELLDRIHLLSDLTWGRLKLMGRGTGTETLPRYRMTVPIPTCIDAQDDILSIRIKQSSRSRLIGFRRDRILHVVWIDPNGACYPHE